MRYTRNTTICVLVLRDTGSSSAAHELSTHEFHFCCHFYLFCSATSIPQESYSTSATRIMAASRESGSHHAAFTCFNVNCYAKFKTERGLKQHLWRNEDCGKYMSEPRPVLAASVGIVHESTWCRRVGYGVEASRVNPFMSADPPSYEPYKVFDYSANFDANDDDLDDWVEFTDNTLVSMDDAALGSHPFPLFVPHRGTCPGSRFLHTVCDPYATSSPQGNSVDVDVDVHIPLGIKFFLSSLQMCHPNPQCV